MMTRAVLLSVVAVTGSFAAAHAAAGGSDQQIAWHATSIEAGDQPFEVLTADLDGDGDIDLAVDAITADWNAGGIPDLRVANERMNVSILIGDGRGGFTINSF